MYQNHRRLILSDRNGFLIEVNYLLSFYLFVKFAVRNIFNRFTLNFSLCNITIIILMDIYCSSKIWNLCSMDCFCIPIYNSSKYIQLYTSHCLHFLFRLLSDDLFPCWVFHTWIVLCSWVQHLKLDVAFIIFIIIFFL